MGEIMENSADNYVLIDHEKHGNLAISLPTFKRAKGRIERQSTLRGGIKITSKEHQKLLLTQNELEKAQKAVQGSSCELDRVPKKTGLGSSCEIDRVRRLEIQDKAKSSKRLSRQRNAGLLVEAKRAFYTKEEQGLN